MENTAVLAGLVFLGLALVSSALILASIRFFTEDLSALFKLARYGIILGVVAVTSAVCVAIGLRLDSRHEETYTRGLKAVQQIWGGEIVQSSPSFTFPVTQTETYTNEKTGVQSERLVTVSREANFQAQKIALGLQSNIRKKGLLFYAGYNLTYQGEYTVANSSQAADNFTFHFALPEAAGNITDMAVRLDGKPAVNDVNFSDGYTWSGRLAPGESKVFKLSYSAQGTDGFTYALANRQIEIKDLAATLETTYEDVRIPEQAMVPTDKAESNQSSRLSWAAKNLITGQNLAVRFEAPGNWGKLAPKMFYYAPLALFLFMGLLLVSTISRGRSLHPMHYFFLSASFFVFYLLGSYLLSFVPIFVAVVGALAVSTGIILYYIHLLKKGPELFRMAALGSGIFQWLFSLAFFFPEYTGLLITLASIVCFVVLMKSTAEIEWENKW